MLARPPTLRALFRTAAPRPAQFTRSFSRVQFRTPTPPLARTSLSITYRALPLHLQNAIPTSVATYRSGAPAPAQEVAAPAPSTTQWTHFATAYSYSSVRTFTSSRISRLASAAAAAAQPASTSPEAAQRIDEVMETISELYASAQDEFEMAFEETEKNTTYAADDREAAREELDKLLEYYNGVLEGDDAAVAEEIKRRAGSRIRELEQAVIRMEEEVSHGD